MRNGVLWTAGVCFAVAALLGVAEAVSFEPDAVLGDRLVELQWMPDDDDPVYTGNLQLFSIGEVAVGSEEQAFLLFPRDADEFWALGRWGGLISHMSLDSETGEWVADSTLDPLPEGVEILCAGIHQQGILIAAGLDDGRIAVWRPAQSRAPAIYRGHAGACHGLVFKPLASELDTSFVSVGDDGFWKVWGRPGALSDSVQAGNGTTLRSIGITREADEVAVGNDAGHISIWPLAFSGTPMPRREMDGHAGRAVTGLVFTERADRLASADEEGGVHVWDAWLGNFLGSYEPPEPSGILISYSPREARYINYAQRNGVVGVLDGFTGRGYQSKDTLDANISGFALSPDGMTGFFGTVDGRIEWWHQGECVPSAHTRECFGGYRIWRGLLPDTTSLELLRIYDFGDTTWGWTSVDTLRIFADPDSIIARGGDTLSVVPGPHNGIPYYYSITKYYWKFLDGGLHRVRKNTPLEGFYVAAGGSEPTALIARVDPATTPPVLSNVFVVPNPYVATEDPSHYGPGSPPLVRFFHLPERAMVRIYTTNGELVRTLEHPQAAPAESGGNLTWDLRNEYARDVAAGVYVYAVRTPSGDQTTGFFTVVR
jgi:WD40 repeat protein